MQHFSICCFHKYHVVIYRFRLLIFSKTKLSKTICPDRRKLAFVPETFNLFCQQMTMYKLQIC